MTTVIVFVTTSSKREAQRITKAVLTRHLIACANILGPVESRFWWKGKVHKANEFLVLMKSNQKLFAELSKAIKEMHSYEVPEVLAVPVVAGLQSYLEWLDAALTTLSEG